MTISLLTAIGIFLFLGLPGMVLISSSVREIWVYVAAAISSQALVILTSALISLLLPAQNILLLVSIVSVGWLGVALRLRPKRKIQEAVKFERWALFVPLIATVTAAYITYGAITVENGDLIVKAWFNADGFKHLGHVNAITHLGLPARDIFGGGERLAYYWFFYVIPASGAVLHGHTAEALVAAGLVQTFAFWILIYGLLRMAGVDQKWANILSSIAWLSLSPDGLTALAALDWNVLRTIETVNVEGMNSELLNGSTLFRLSLYIPQHQFMLAGLLAWGLIFSLEDQGLKWIKRLSLGPLICAGAISTLFGMACLVIYGLTRIFDDRIGIRARVIEIATVGLLALAIPLLFQVVGMAEDSGLSSPIFSSGDQEHGWLARFILALPGIFALYGVSLLGLVGLYRFKGQAVQSLTMKPLYIFSAVLTLGGIAIMLATVFVDNQRIALEAQLRMSLLPFAGLTIATAWLIVSDPEKKQRFCDAKILRYAIIFAAIGLATPVLDGFWHVARSDRWALTIPADDLSVLKAIKRQTPQEAIILQYPELPFVSQGRDVWVAVVGERIVFSSPRSTHWGEQQGRVDAIEAFFRGTGDLPEGDFDYIYLSRALHPTSYDLLKRRLTASGLWKARQCNANACLLERGHRVGSN